MEVKEGSKAETEKERQEEEEEEGLRETSNGK
jgi:hypothetical protein